ncbi:hypothetical protein D3C87_2138570 [compost metagenome]
MTWQGHQRGLAGDVDDGPALPGSYHRLGGVFCDQKGAARIDGDHLVENGNVSRHGSCDLSTETAAIHHAP